MSRLVPAPAGLLLLYWDTMGITMGIPPPQPCREETQIQTQPAAVWRSRHLFSRKEILLFYLVMFEAQPLPLDPHSTTLKPQFGNSFEKGWLKPGGQMQSSFYMDGCERFSVSGRCRCCMFCDFCDTRLQPPAQNLCSGAVMMLLDVVPQIDPSVPQPVVQSRRRPLLGPSPG